MPDPIKEFFEGINTRHDQRLKAAGSVRVDLTDGSGTDSWYIRFGKGRAQASQEVCDADTVIKTNPPFFAQLIRGDANVMSAWLRNQVTVTGSVYLLDLFQRLLPGRAEALDPRISHRQEVRRP
jgi:putative sterol carrier protein